MLPIDVTFKGVKYKADRQVLTEALQYSLYGTHDQIDLSVNLIRSELKAEPTKKDKVIVDAPRFGYKNKTMRIHGIRTDPAGITVGLDLEDHYAD